MEEWTIRSLIDELNRLTKLYDEGHPEVSDEYWDNLYFELEKKEKETGIIYSDSPTQNIHFEQVSALEKSRHTHPMLSLSKTKDIEEIKSFVSGYDWLAMFKMDGLSCSLVYVNGSLDHAETRGNGEIGEDITHNIYTIKNVPLKIKTNEKIIVVDGEIISTWDNFDNFKEEYKNPRNFAAGSIRLLDPVECGRRNLRFIAWDLITGRNDIDYFAWRLEKLDDWGFTTVPCICDAETVEDAIKYLDQLKSFTTYPLDGYVFRFESQKYYNSLGSTSHHFNGAKAYKFYDETYETKLKWIEWTMGRTGVLTPVAIFEPVDIECTKVERASLHNVNIMHEILGDCAYIGESLQVAKMNMIIPQIIEAGPKYNYEEIIALKKTPANCVIEKCPYCGHPVTYKKSEGNVINVYCENKLCEGKLVNRLDHFCGKKGLDIKGLSKATLEKFIDWGWVESIEDIYYISERHGKDFLLKPGFGTKSVNKILNAIEDSKHTTLNAFLSAAGIPLIGQTAAKDLSKHFKTYEEFRNAVEDDTYNFFILDNFGEEMNNSIKNFDYTEMDKISKLLSFKPSIVNYNQENGSLSGKTIVITGKLTTFKNRAELKSVIESLGGKVSDSISSKTDLLINNDVNSTSSKNQKAQKLNIPIISERDFVEQYVEK